MDATKQSRLRRRLLLSLLVLAIGAEISINAFNHYSTEKALSKVAADHGWTLDWDSSTKLRNWTLQDQTGKSSTRIRVRTYFTTVGACTAFRAPRSIERIMVFLEAPAVGDEVRFRDGAKEPPLGNVKVSYISFRNGRYGVDVSSFHLSFDELTSIAKKLDEATEDSISIRVFGYPLEGGFVERLILESGKKIGFHPQIYSF